MQRAQVCGCRGLLPFRQRREFPVEQGEVAFPGGIVRREFCQARHDRLAFPQIVARLCLVVGMLVHPGELGKAHREIALPFRIAGVGVREALSPTADGAEGPERRC
jgi:hypothetical protein